MSVLSVDADGSQMNDTEQDGRYREDIEHKTAVIRATEHSQHDAGTSLRQ
jgi:hypothetical protein